MKENLLHLFQVFNSSAERTIQSAEIVPEGTDWLSKMKYELFLNPDEIFFSVDWIKLIDGDSETYIDWDTVEFFYYPFVGVNIKLPGFHDSRYFSLIVKEEMENDPLLEEFISRLSRQKKTSCRLS